MKVALKLIKIPDDALFITAKWLVQQLAYRIYDK